MKTIEFDLKKGTELGELTNLFKQERIAIGEEKFNLKILSNYNDNNALYAGFLLLLVKYILNEKVKNKKQAQGDINYYDKATNYYYDIYFKTNNVKKLESKIEKDFKMDIQLEKKNPLDEVFGIWKNSPVTLDKIRSKAWHRGK